VAITGRRQRFLCQLGARRPARGASAGEAHIHTCTLSTQRPTAGQKRRHLAGVEARHLGRDEAECKRSVERVRLSPMARSSATPATIWSRAQYAPRPRNRGPRPTPPQHQPEGAAAGRPPSCAPHMAGERAREAAAPSRPQVVPRPSASESVPPSAAIVYATLMRQCPRAGTRTASRRYGAASWRPPPGERPRMPRPGSPRRSPWGRRGGLDPPCRAFPKKSAAGSPRAGPVALRASPRRSHETGGPSPAVLEVALEPRPFSQPTPCERPERAMTPTRVAPTPQAGGRRAGALLPAAAQLEPFLRVSLTPRRSRGGGTAMKKGPASSSVPLR